MDNYKEFKEFLHNLDSKPKLLLHACCAPCSSHTITVLKDYFKITIFYSNDNIYPFSEYKHRLDEIERFASEISSDIDVIYDEYESNDYYNAVKGLEKLGEKSERCYQCYKLRMRKTALKALELGYDYFTTTLSISPYKVERWINEIGYELERELGIKYLYSNFKKEEGYKHSIKMSEEYHLYRQDYCGCVFSKEERRIQIEENQKKNY